MEKQSSLIRNKIFRSGVITAGSILIILAITAYSIATPTPAAYAQYGPPDQAKIFSGASPEAQSFAVNIATTYLWNNITDPIITFSEDGQLMMTDTGYDKDGHSLIINVMVPHNLTAANGYRYDNNIIYAPNGTRIFP